MSNTDQISTSSNATSVAENKPNSARKIGNAQSGHSIVHADNNTIESKAKEKSTSNSKMKTEVNKRKGLDSKTLELIKRMQQEKLQREKEMEEEQKAEEIREKLREEEQAKERERLARVKEADRCQVVKAVRKKPFKIVSQTQHASDSPTISKPRRRILYPDRKSTVARENVSIKSVDPIDEPSADTSVHCDTSSSDEWEKEFDLIPEIVEVTGSIPQKADSETAKDAIIKELRAPILCVMGHVDAGKTTLLDNLRHSNVQKNEAGGITQQLGATNVPVEILHQRTTMCEDLEYKIPGFLIIDTPGHAIFQHLRSRGSSVCDMAILVVDAMHGLQVETIKSIELLLERKMPFIVALNKIDQIYGWQNNPEKDIQSVLSEQKPFARDQIERQIQSTILKFAENGCNVGLYCEDFDWNDYYPIIPISAKTGDGMGTLIGQIVKQCQSKLFNQLIFEGEVQASVMEVKTVPGLGLTLDIILVNGYLSVGNNILVATQEGPLVTQIRSLWVPAANEELRVTNHFEQCDTVSGARSVRIVAKSLDKALAGLPIFLIRNAADEKHGRIELDEALQTMLNSIRVKQTGVYVQTSTFGSLEGLLKLLKEHGIPYAGVSIGTVHRKDVLRASTQLEKDPKYGTILAFDVLIDRTAQEYANKINVRIFQDDEVYRLVKKFKDYEMDLFKENKEKNRHLAIFPCQLRILPGHVFAGRNPIICGVRVEDGLVKVGTPICVPSKGRIELGCITSIQMNHKSIEMARKGAEISIKIESATGDSSKIFGRHFDENDLLISKISRLSIDTLKRYFQDEMTNNDWNLVIKLKKLFEIL